jgi:Ras-related protein Rab-5C
MRRWVSELQKQASPNIVLALAGNKCDLASHREVTQADLDKYLQELRKDTSNGASVKKDDAFIAVECSAKTSQGVNELFTDICRKLIELYK